MENFIINFTLISNSFSILSKPIYYTDIFHILCARRMTTSWFVGWVAFPLEREGGNHKNNGTISGIISKEINLN